MAIFLLVGCLLGLADGPEYVTVPAGHQTVYEGTARQCITQDGKDSVAEGSIRVVQIVLDELADGTREVVRIVTKKPEAEGWPVDWPVETMPQVYTIDPTLGMGRQGMAVALHGSALPDLPPIIDVPLTMEQIELEEGETKERPLAVFGQPVKALTFAIEALDSDLYRITASPAEKLPLDILEGEQLTAYTETYTVDPLEERVVGYRLDWGMKWAEGTARYTVDVEETSDREIDGSELARLTKGAHSIQKIQQASYQENVTEAEKLLAAFEGQVKGTALVAAATGLRKSLDDFKQFREQQAREERLVAQMMNKPAPDFTLESLAGDKVSLAEFSRGKVTLLSFWGYG